jgi:PIN domain nuclease of toxin-antitoxin system
VEGVELRYLLDTAAWINGVTLPQVLPERIRRLLNTAEPKGLCSITLLETAILFRLGRLSIEGTLSEFFAAGLAGDLQILELTPSIAARTNEFPPGFPGDPFDRTIAATAAELGLTLITADPAIRDAKICAVEFYPFRPSRAKG